MHDSVNNSSDNSTHKMIRLHRERAGEGAPVVLSHGLGDDASTWAALAPLLAAGHSVHTWDLRGHQRSEAPGDAGAYTLECATDDLLGIVEEIAEPVHLVGHSLGGFISLALALRRPDLVRTLTMISSGPGYRDPEAREAWNRYVDRAVERMPVAPMVAGLARQEDSWVIDHASELQPPLLIVVGERDDRFQPGAAYLSRAVSGSTLVQVAGAGHHPQQTHAHDVAASLLDLLCSTDRTVTR